MCAGASKADSCIPPCAFVDVHGRRCLHVCLPFRWVGVDQLVFLRALCGWSGQGLTDSTRIQYPTVGPPQLVNETVAVRACSSFYFQFGTSTAGDCPSAVFRHENLSDCPHACPMHIDGLSDWRCVFRIAQYRIGVFEVVTLVGASSLELRHSAGFVNVLGASTSALFAVACRPPHWSSVGTGMRTV